MLFEKWFWFDFLSLTKKCYEISSSSNPGPKIIRSILKRSNQANSRVVREACVHPRHRWAPPKSGKGWLYSEQSSGRRSDLAKEDQALHCRLASFFCGIARGMLDLLWWSTCHIDDPGLLGQICVGHEDHCRLSVVQHVQHVSLQQGIGGLFVILGTPVMAQV